MDSRALTLIRSSIFAMKNYRLGFFDSSRTNKYTEKQLNMKHDS